MDGQTLWLDSGAFSAWNVGREIDLDHYIAYIKANIEHIDYYVNVEGDVNIGGDLTVASVWGEGSTFSLTLPTCCKSAHHRTAGWNYTWSPWRTCPPC